MRVHRVPCAPAGVDGRAVDRTFMRTFDIPNGTALCTYCNTRRAVPTGNRVITSQKLTGESTMYVCFLRICMCTDLYLVSLTPQPTPAGLHSRLLVCPLCAARRRLVISIGCGLCCYVSRMRTTAVAVPLPGPVGDVAGRSPSTINTIGMPSPSPREHSVVFSELVLGAFGKR